MSGWVYLGLTSTKQRIKCLAQGHNAVAQDRVEPQPLDLESGTLPLAHSAPLLHWLPMSHLWDAIPEKHFNGQRQIV